jgi:hypothetical protein
MTDIAKLRELIASAPSSLAGPSQENMWTLWLALPSLLDEVERLRDASEQLMKLNADRGGIE